MQTILLFVIFNAEATSYQRPGLYAIIYEAKVYDSIIVVLIEMLCRLVLLTNGSTYPFI